MIEILYVNLQMSYRFSPLYPYLPEDIDFCFHLIRFSNYCQVKLVKHCKKDWGQFKTRYCLKFDDSWCKIHFEILD